MLNISISKEVRDAELALIDAALTYESEKARWDDAIFGDDATAALLAAIREYIGVIERETK